MRDHGLGGYSADMLEISWALDFEDDEGPQDDIRLRGPVALKATMERIAEIQTRALKGPLLKRRKGMSANKLWLSIGSNFAIAFVTSFGPLPEAGDEAAERLYSEKVAAAMQASFEKRKRQKQKK